MSSSHGHEDAARPPGRGRDRLRQGHPGRRRLTDRLRPRHRVGGLILSTTPAGAADDRRGARARPRSAARRSASSTRFRSRSTTASRSGAPSGRRASTDTAGSIAPRASPTCRSRRPWKRSRPARCRRERRDEASAGALLALAVTLAGVGWRARGSAPRSRWFSRRGASEPLAALQDIDVIEHLGDKVPAGLTSSTRPASRCPLGSLLGRGKPVLVTLGYHRCPMLCGLVLDGLVKAQKASGLKLGKDFLRRRRQHRSRRGRQLLAKTQKRVLELAGAGATAADWPFWLVPADGGAAARALADAVGLSLQVRPDVEAVRPRRRRVRADARRA